MAGFIPRDLSEALEKLASNELTVYAGGTDLMVEGDDSLDYLFIGKLPELRSIQTDSEYVRIGAACTFTEALEHPDVPDILKEALSRIAAPAIRNIGTMGGNVANGTAKADTVLVHFAADSKIKLLSKDGERTINIVDFYLGRKQLNLRKGELVAEILVPRYIPSYYYKKVGAREALAISRVSFASVYEVEDGIIKRFSAAFGAVSGKVLRFRELENSIIGMTLKEAKAIKPELMKKYDDAIVPIQGRVSSEYRKTVCLNLLDDCLKVMGV